MCPLVLAELPGTKSPTMEGPMALDAYVAGDGPCMYVCMYVARNGEALGPVMTQCPSVEECPNRKARVNGFVSRGETKKGITFEM